MGQQHYALTQQAEGGLYMMDAELTKYVSSVGQRVAAVSDRQLPYQFVVLNNSTPNAWALPGGKIAINRGLLVELDNEAELAAVLSHEVVHAAARHGAKSMQRDLLFGVIQLGITHASKDSKNSNYAIGGASLALGLVSQKYGRDAERTSDYHGMKYMRAAGYDTATAITLQEKFVALSKDNKRNWLNGLFASHPPSTERVTRNREALAQFPAGGMVGRERYQERLAYLLSRKDAYHQAERAKELLATDAKSALRAINNSIKKEPKESLFHGIKGHILARQGKLTKATQAFSTAIKLNAHSGYYENFLGRGLAYQSLGQPERARADLKRSNELLPTAVAAYNLGDIALAIGERKEAKMFFKSASEASDKIGDLARKSFVKLDIVDDPWRYVELEILFEPGLFDKGQVVIKATNKTAHALRNIMVLVSASINEKTTEQRSTLGILAANASKNIPSGIWYREEDEVQVTIKEMWVESAN